MRPRSGEMTLTHRVGRIDGITKARNRSTPEIVGLPEQPRADLPWICVKTYEQPFYGTVFVF